MCQHGASTEQVQVKTQTPLPGNASCLGVFDMSAHENEVLCPRSLPGLHCYKTLVPTVSQLQKRPIHLSWQKLSQSRLLVVHHPRVVCTGWRVVRRAHKLCHYIFSPTPRLERRRIRIIFESNLDESWQEQSYNLVTYLSTCHGKACLSLHRDSDPISPYHACLSLTSCELP